MDRFLDFHKRVYEPACEGFFDRFKKKPKVEEKKFVSPTFPSIEAFCDAPCDETTVEPNSNSKSGIISGIDIDLWLSKIDTPMSSEDRSIIIKAFRNIKKVQSALSSSKFINSTEYDDCIPDDISKADFKISSMNIEKYSNRNFEFNLFCKFPKTNDGCRLSDALDETGNYTGNLWPTFR